MQRGPGRHGAGVEVGGGRAAAAGQLCCGQEAGYQRSLQASQLQRGPQMPPVCGPDSPGHPQPVSSLPLFGSNRLQWLFIPWVMVAQKTSVTGCFPFWRVVCRFSALAQGGGVSTIPSHGARGLALVTVC